MSKMMSKSFYQALEIRCDFALQRLLAKNGLLNPATKEEYEVQSCRITTVDVDDTPTIPPCGPKKDAFELGASSPEPNVRALFRGTVLEVIWQIGREECEELEALREEVENANGTREEWNALSSEEQSVEWNDFLDRNALGIAGDMYFDRVMMDEHLVGYVGD